VPSDMCEFACSMGIVLPLLEGCSLAYFALLFALWFKAFEQIASPKWEGAVIPLIYRVSRRAGPPCSDRETHGCLEVQHG